METGEAKPKLTAAKENFGREICVFETSASSSLQNEESNTEETDDLYEFTAEDYYRIMKYQEGSGKAKPLKQPKAEKEYNEDKAEQLELPKYRDRDKERRDDQNLDYEANELGSFHTVAPPGNIDLGAADVHKLSIEKSKYLGGDLEHMHLVKGLDYTLLTKVRSEIDKKPNVGDEVDAKSRASKEDQKVSFRTATAKSVYQWIVNPRRLSKPMRCS